MFKKFGQAIKGFFNRFVQLFKSFIDAAIPLAKQEVLGMLSDIGDEVVSKLDPMTLTNEAKREAAFKEISEYSKSRGINAKDHVIYLLIELAYSKLRELKP